MSFLSMKLNKWDKRGKPQINNDGNYFIKSKTTAYSNPL